LVDLWLAEPSRDEKTAALAEGDRLVQESAGNVLYRIQALSERIAGQSWETDPVLLHHIEKELRKIRRHAEKLGKMVGVEAD
jgi:hypothetical protein